MPGRKKKKKWRSAAAHRLQKLAGDPSTVEEAIKTVAQWLLHDVNCAPTDLEALGAKLKVMQFVEADTASSAELREDGDQFYIAYSPHLSHARRRFAIARQLGHAVFAATGPNCPNKGIELERLCDMLAVEFLMPNEVFQREIGSQISIEKVIELAQTFEVSLAATAIRCAERPFVSVFEVEDDKITWGYGSVQHGLIQSMDIELQNIIKMAIKTNYRYPQQFFSAEKPWFGSWGVEWTHISHNKVLFLVRLLRREEKQQTEENDLKRSIAQTLGFHFMNEEQ